jgi:ArsR family transcriptional regulator
MTTTKSKPRSKAGAGSGSAGLVLTDEALEMVAARFRVLSEASRLRLLGALHGGERNVSELTAATGLTQANVSRHLGVLAEAGLVSRRKEGLNVIYAIADPTIFELCEHVCGSLQRRLERATRALAR